MTTTKMIANESTSMNLSTLHTAKPASKKRAMKIAALAIVAFATLPSVFETSANAWPSLPSPPPPPPPPSLPSLPTPPLPPFKIDSRAFMRGGNTDIPQIPASGCSSNQDWLFVRGSNIALATNVSQTGGDNVSWQRQGPSSQCGFPDCAVVLVRTYQQTAVGPRTLTFKAIDGRTVSTTFDVKGPSGRCDNVSTSTSSSGGATHGASTSQSGSPPPTSSSSSSSPVPQQPPPQQTLFLTTTRSKTCQGSSLVMSSSQAFTTRATQNVKVNVSFQSFSPCWCPSSPSGTCTVVGARTWVLRRKSDGLGVSVPWVQGESTVANLPAGQWEIDLAEGSVPPGSFSVTYTP